MGIRDVLRSWFFGARTQAVEVVPTRSQLAAAIDRATRERITERRALRGGRALIGIDNDDCYDVGHPECEGWDGYSPMCQCGATRVRWRWDEFAEGVEVEPDCYIDPSEPDPSPGDVLVRGQVVNVAAELGALP